MEETARTRAMRRETTDEGPTTARPVSFDVVVQRTIGRVNFGQYDGSAIVDVTGKLRPPNPYECAMLIIAQNGEPGIYSFPASDHGNITVTIEYPIHAKED